MVVIDASFANKPELDWGPGVEVGAHPPISKTTPRMREWIESRWKEYGLD